MEQIIITGSNASGLISALPGMYVQVKSIEIDLPLNEVGISGPAVTVSGSYTGSYTLRSDTTLDLNFAKGEDVYITSDDFTANYSAIVRYVRGGEQNCYRAITSRYHTIPIPSRLK